MKFYIWSWCIQLKTSTKKPCIHVGSHKLKTIKDIHTNKVQPAPPHPSPTPKRRRKKSNYVQQLNIEIILTYLLVSACTALSVYMIKEHACTVTPCNNLQSYGCISSASMQCHTMAACHLVQCTKHLPKHNLAKASKCMEFPEEITTARLVMAREHVLFVLLIYQLFPFRSVMTTVCNHIHT